MTYASVVWWTSMSYGRYIEAIQKVQRLCCLGISGAIRTTSTRAMKTILAIHLIEIQVQYEVALAMMRLKTTGEWIEGYRITGHRTIIEQVPGFNVTYCDRIPERLMPALCNTLIPNREPFYGNALGSIFTQMD